MANQSKFGLDLSRFKKLHSDGGTTTLQHPQGHSITIVHAQVHPRLREQLAALPDHEPKAEKKLSVKDNDQKSKPSFDDGGAVDSPKIDPQSAADMQKGAMSGGTSASDAWSNLKSGLGMAKGGQVPKKAGAATSAQQKEHYADGTPDGGAQQMTPINVAAANNPPTNMTPNDPVVEQQTYQNPNDLPYGTAQEPAKDDDSDLTKTQPTAGDLGQTTSDQTPQAGASPDLMGKYANDLTAARAEERAGITQGMSAAGSLGRTENELYQNAAQQTQDAMTEYQGHMGDLQQERQGFLQDYKDQKIDPNHYLNSMGVGQKIATGIGMILAGAGAGRGANPVLGMLNQQIDRDIDSQKAELGKKQNLLTANTQSMQNLQQGTAMTRMMQRDIVSNQIQAAIAKTSDPMAKARGMQALGALDAQSAAEQHQLAIQRTLYGPDNQIKNPAMAIRLLAPPTEQAGLMKDLQTKQNMDANTNNLLKDFDYLASHNTVLNKLNPQEQSRMAAVWDPNMVKLAHESAGRFNMEELPIMNKYKPTALDDKKTIDQKRAAFKAELTSRSNFPSLQMYGGNGPSAGSAPVKNFRPIGK